ncbi:MAG: tyrosine--tRNA ligase, partial [Novibacillus thermophilus]
EEAAEGAEQHFKTVFQQNALPEDIPEVVLGKGELENGKLWIVKLLTRLDLVPSNGEARRMVGQGAVKIDGQKVEGAGVDVDVTDGMIVQVGKRKFARVRVEA